MSEKPVVAETVDNERDAQMLRELDLVKCEGGELEYDPISLKSQQWLERTQVSPGTLIDENVDWRYWKGLEGHLKRICRRTKNEALQKARELCWMQARSLAKARVGAMTPFRSQFEFHDNLCARLIMPLPEGTPQSAVLGLQLLIGEAMRCWREENYVYFNNRYLDRKIG